MSFGGFRKTKAKKGNDDSLQRPVSKYKNKEKDGFRSILEKKINDLFVLNGINACYECKNFILLEPFKYDNKSYRKISYNPDFIIMNKYVIEVKGFSTPEFKIKWKLFLHHLVLNNLHYKPYIVKTVKEAENLINEIKKDKLFTS